MFLESSAQSEKGRQSEPGGRRWKQLFSVLPLEGEKKNMQENERKKEY